ncbi:MAG: FAD-dependent oxidoreductase [Cyanothece sp. SIO1E1]|nr:FAD-dependent oxidoreductase [Cyanothece sp. SIO1E1]
MEVSTEDLPLLTYGKHELFRKPSLPQIAAHIGIQREVKKECYDTIIIGAGPSGLGAAVYSSSEGLSTLVLDQIGPGGQAGSSSKIENYAGFPAGLSGRELALRSYLQALKFGADFIAPCTVYTIRRLTDGKYGVDLCTDETAVGRTVIIATGINYRSLKVPGMEQLRGSGVYYNATQVEATLCEDKPVHVIGAGNSAGQAAMFLSSFACEVNLLIRGESMAKSMSEYLWARIEQNSKIKIRYKTELAAIHGEENIQAVEVLNKATGTQEREETSGVFIFIGGTPCTDFLPEDIERDDHGFVKAGTDLATTFEAENGRFPCALDTSYPGVFVSGECRAGTTKRVAFAIGDGALAVTCVHEFLGTYS